MTPRSTPTRRHLRIDDLSTPITEVPVRARRPGRIARLLGRAPKRIEWFTVDPPFLPPATGDYWIDLNPLSRTATITPAEEATNDA